MIQSDLTYLRRDQIDLKKGTITRGRSKTGHKGGKVVTYPLWPETLEVLRQFIQNKGELALLSERGTPLSNNRCKPRSDSIWAAHRRLFKRMKLDVPAFRCFRATAADLMDKTEHKHAVDRWLAHAPQSIKDRHYVNANDEDVAKAVNWLREAIFGSAEYHSEAKSFHGLEWPEKVLRVE
jgi:integrase